MISTLVDHLDTLTRSYWEGWRTLKLNQGWTLGVDNGAAKMSPYLVHSFDGLDAAGQQHFRQQVALMLHAIDSLGIEQPKAPGQVADSSDQDDAREKAIQKLGSALKALDEADFVRAKRKVRTAFRLLKGESIRPQSKKS